MNEKIYKSMSYNGCWNLAIGISLIVTGIATGVVLIVNGARMIKQKYQITI